MEEIPLDIVKQVFSRLPVKSLVRFNCVSKQWLSTISHDPQFHRLHLNRQNTKLIILIQPNTFYSMDCETQRANCASLQKIESPTTSNGIRLCGSCDGLILLSESKKSFILWNPSIKSYREIKTPPDLIYPSTYGLCYDSSLDDYKVVIVSSLEKTLGYCHNLFYTVFSLKSNRWTAFKKFRYGAFRGGNKGIIVNGALHWIVGLYDPSFSSTSKSRGVIVYYDVVEDEFKEVSGPDNLNDPNLLCSRLANLRGCLCIYESTNSYWGLYELKVWEMKEYGVKESWTLLFELGPNVESSMHPLCFNKKGEVVMQFCSKSVFLVLNIRRWFGTLKAFDNKIGVLADTYIESLASAGGELNVGLK